MLKSSLTGKMIDRTLLRILRNCVEGHQIQASGRLGGHVCSYHSQSPGLLSPIKVRSPNKTKQKASLVPGMVDTPIIPVLGKQRQEDHDIHGHPGLHNNTLSQHKVKMKNKNKD
jgi:hypothetical protein